MSPLVEPVVSGASRDLHACAPMVSRGERARIKGQRPMALWFTGLSGAGKSTIAMALEARLVAAGYHTCVLDGDNLRLGLNQDLGFCAADRIENLRRAAEVSRLMLDAGLIVITALISPFRVERAWARATLPPGEFAEVFVDAPLEETERRDPKGLYRRARRGELPLFTGVDSPYEAPITPDLRLDTTCLSPDAAVDRLMVLLRMRGVLAPEDGPKTGVGTHPADRLRGARPA